MTHLNKTKRDEIISKNNLWIIDNGTFQKVKRDDDISLNKQNIDNETSEKKPKVMRILVRI